MSLRSAACALILAVPAGGWAQVAAGPEFRVNTYTTRSQNAPAVAADAQGNFVVAWQLANDLPRDLRAQRYDAAGAPRGGEFRVNTNTAPDQRTPRVALDAGGGFVVAWAAGPDADRLDVFAQRFDPAGAPRGSELSVNTYTTDAQSYAAVASDARGNFIVVWHSESQNGGSTGVFAQRYDAAGVPQGGEFRVNTYTGVNQSFPDVFSEPSGSFVVVWNAFELGKSGYGVFARRFDAAGNPRGAEFRVNTYTTLGQLGPSLAHDASGGFVVVWSSAVLHGGSYVDVFGQRFDAGGVPRGAEFQVNTFTPNLQVRPRVASDARGNFVVAWQSYLQDGSVYAVIGQRYDAAGNRRGAEFRVNTFTTGYQYLQSVSSDAVGNFTVVWRGAFQDGSSAGIFGQRFGGLRPADLDVDSAGNGVFEPGEAVDVRPAWRNVNGLAQTFGGALTDMGGPPGPVYSIGDGAASYGSVPNGSTAQCVDCYAVGVTSPPQRPATHWDAALTETITPDAHGQQIRWRLHLGDSFTDVPRVNPFYRFVEALLHHGVTAGCTNATYCPSSSTTREQMAVFVLVAKEGAGYAPPACGPPNIFDDVPENSPFCRWIEELSNRGVVSGCAVGRYCPGDPVTREQMAVFVLRTLDSALDPPACATPVFADVPASSPFCRWIEELARRGVVSGCAPGLYCPASPVSREQMGVFLGVTFGLTLYGP